MNLLHQRHQLLRDVAEESSKCPDDHIHWQLAMVTTRSTIIMILFEHLYNKIDNGWLCCVFTFYIKS